MTKLSTAKGSELSRFGLGCMRMSMVQKSTRKESLATIHTALDEGINFLNTGDFYGDDGHNEKLIGEAMESRSREDIFLSVKYGTFSNFNAGTVDVGPKNAKKFITESLKRLNTDYIDLYQPARIDLGIPLEDTIGEISKMIEVGYVRHVGLSEVEADTLKRAHAIHPIGLVELEYSIMNSCIESDQLPVARELGIGVVAFGMLGMGRLFKNAKDPLSLVINEIAGEKGISPARIAHAWMLAKGDDVLPLIGSRIVSQLRDSVESRNVIFTEKDISRIENGIQASGITGPSMPKMVIKNGKVMR